jgi:Hsp20/alpha crystallin family
MVERSHTAGWPSQIYAPQRQMNEKTTYWFAPKADGAMTEDYYGISVELPGVTVGDLQIIAQDGTLTVQGEKRFDHTESGRTYFFSEREYGASSVPSACHPMPQPIGSMPCSRTVFSRSRFQSFSRQLGTAAGSPFVLNNARGPATTRRRT